MSISGEGRGEYINEPFGGEELSGLDKEWFELQQQLDTESQAQTHADEVVDHLAADIYDAFDTYDLPRVVDRDPDVDTQLGIEYIDSLRDKILEELRWSDEGASETDEARAVISAFKAYHDRREAEMSVLYCALSYKLVSLHRAEKGLDDQYMFDLKGDLLAHFHVHYKLETEWLQFFHDVTNEDDAVTPYYEAVENRHFDAAWESLPEYLDEQEKKWRVFDEALEIVGAENLDDDQDFIVELTAVIIDMLSVASSPVHSEVERANRNELLWECGRDSELDNDTIKALTDYFDRIFPVEG